MLIEFFENVKLETTTLTFNKVNSAVRCLEIFVAIQEFLYLSLFQPPFQPSTKMVVCIVTSKKQNEFQEIFWGFEVQS